MNPVQLQIFFFLFQIHNQSNVSFFLSFQTQYSELRENCLIIYISTPKRWNDKMNSNLFGQIDWLKYNQQGWANLGHALQVEEGAWVHVKCFTSLSTSLKISIQPWDFFGLVDGIRNCSPLSFSWRISKPGSLHTDDIWWFVPNPHWRRVGAWPSVGHTKLLKLFLPLF